MTKNEFSNFEILHNDDGKKGVFTANENATQAGLMSYTWGGDTLLIIDHTEVSEGFNGRGVGKELVMAAVNFARTNQKKIIPLCPFAKSVFVKTQSINDVLS